jgi:hypothetical protein
LTDAARQQIDELGATFASARVRMPLRSRRKRSASIAVELDG